MNTIDLGNTHPTSEDDPACFKFINLRKYWVFSRIINPSDNTSALPIIFTMFGQIAPQECYLTTAGRCLCDFETHAPNYSASFWLEPCFSLPLWHGRWRNRIRRLQNYLDYFPGIETTDLLSREHSETRIKFNWSLITDEMVCIFPVIQHLFGE
jgi:hypothetical protein